MKNNRSFLLSLAFFILTLVGVARAFNVYITVDDGPLTGTKEIIAIIDESKIVANFLLVGEHVEASAEHRRLLKESESDPRILVGNHSYTHANGRYRRFYENPQNVLADFQRNQNLLNSVRPGKPMPKIARLPGRNVWVVGNRKAHDLRDAVASADLLAKDGYTVFGWDIEWMHNGRTGEPIESVETLVAQVMGKVSHAFTRGHVVILMHDQMFRKMAEGKQLERLIETLEKNGAVFKTLAEYPI